MKLFLYILLAIFAFVSADYGYAHKPMYIQKGSEHYGSQVHSYEAHAPYPTCGSSVLVSCASQQAKVLNMKSFN